MWSVAPDTGLVAASAATKDATTQFQIEFLGDRLAFKASNGKYVSQKKNGAIYAIAEKASAEDASTFIWEIINRPTLILRGEQGFVGTNASGVLECNKAIFEEYLLHITKGECFISGSNGKYWKVNSETISVDGNEPQKFFFELVDLSRVVIKYQGKFLQGFTNGGLVLAFDFLFVFDCLV